MVVWIPGRHCEQYNWEVWSRGMILNNFPPRNYSRGSHSDILPCGLLWHFVDWCRSRPVPKLNRNKTLQHSTKPYFTRSTAPLLNKSAFIFRNFALIPSVLDSFRSISLGGTYLAAHFGHRLTWAGGTYHLRLPPKEYSQVRCLACTQTPSCFRLETTGLSVHAHSQLLASLFFPSFPKFSSGWLYQIWRKHKFMLPLSPIKWGFDRSLQVFFTLNLVSVSSPSPNVLTPHLIRQKVDDSGKHLTPTRIKICLPGTSDALLSVSSEFIFSFITLVFLSIATPSLPLYSSI